MDAPEHETPYTEIEALLAVMNDDRERAQTLVEGMLPAERLGFYQQLGVLADIVGHQIAEESGTTASAGRHRKAEVAEEDVPSPGGVPCTCLAPGIEHCDRCESWDPQE